MQAALNDSTVELLLLRDPQYSDAPEPHCTDALETEEQAKSSLGCPSTAFSVGYSDRQHLVKWPLSSSSRSSLGRHSIRRPDRSHAHEEDLDIIRDNLSMRHLMPLVKPLVYLLGGVALAVGHHFFNSWADGRHVGPPTKIPQVWIFRVGTAFAFAFKTILAASLTFAICQLLWFSTRRNYLSVQDIDALYQVERRNILSTFMPNAVMNGPLLVGATLLSFLLQIATVFTPASLGVKTANYAQEAPCTVPSGNFSALYAYPDFYQENTCEEPVQLSPSVERLSEVTFIRGTPTPLPEFCGQNCTYRVAMDSVAFKCEENVQLPREQVGIGGSPSRFGPWTFWNATLASDSMRLDSAFEVGWASRTLGGDGEAWWTNETFGSARCIPVSARYDFTVQTFNGVQTFSYDVTTGDQLSISAMTEAGGCVPMVEGSSQAVQISSIVFASRRLLLGSLWWSLNLTTAGAWDSDTTVGLAPFLNMTEQGYSTSIIAWGDVVKGIEDTPAHITAALLHKADPHVALDDSTCSYIHSDLVYDYNPPNLWGPYGVAILIVTLSLISGAFVLVRYNPENLTTSFVDTVSITRNLEMDRLARKPDEPDESKSPLSLPTFRLKMSGEYLGYTKEVSKEL